MADNVIKSVRRVIEILELFDNLQTPLQAVEIARRLDYPVASTHALLKSLHVLGYFDYDAPKWSYMPSRSFPAVLDWVADFYGSEGRILDFMAELNSVTKETINLSRRVHTQVKIIYGIESIHPLGVSVKIGTLMPLVNSLTGIAAMAHMSKKELFKFLKQLEARDQEQFEVLNRPLLDDIFAEVREKGTTCRCDLFLRGVGAVCFPIQPLEDKQPLVVGVVGPSDRIDKNGDEYSAVIRQLAAEHKIKMLF